MYSTCYPFQCISPVFLLHHGISLRGKDDLALRVAGGGQTMVDEEWVDQNKEGRKSIPNSSLNLCHNERGRTRGLRSAFLPNTRGKRPVQVSAQGGSVAHRDLGRGSVVPNG